MNPDPGQETETKIFGHVLRPSDSPGHSERKRQKGRHTKRWEDNIKGWTGMDFASSTREEKIRWKRTYAKSSVVSQRSCKIMG